MNNEGKYETNPAIHVIFEEVTDIRWDPSKNLFFFVVMMRLLDALGYGKKIKQGMMLIGRR